MAAELQQTFLQIPHFAVVGASKDQNKWGTKILKWYQTRDLDVIPVHHRESELEGLQTLKSLAELPSPTETAVTLGILESAKELNIPVVWLQPGAEDEDVRKYINDAGLSERVILGGPCLWRDGDGILKVINKL
ncbi:NAD P-binding protein [Pyrrhoderma noxium]|uniref:NAD P-binding protein n=1 Tax=Pyrrhoderma noxium TaxID=2282107 RepID=A0A286UFT6_9AGAM|nr:NAD P-binding protein [Pyrrhoderma noxium]